MATEVKATVANAVQVQGEFINIPKLDKLGRPHPGVAINLQNFEAGKTYTVHPDIAAEVNRILVRFDEETIRILHPDYKDRLARAKQDAFIG